MRNRTLVLILISIMSVFAGGQAKSAPKTAYNPVPVSESRRPNPVKPTPESIAEGKKIYGYDCTSCHGATGDGKTDAAKTIKIPDFTDPAALKDRTDGDLFYVIKNGSGNMPLEGDRVKPDQLWDLVNYVRSLPKKTAPSDKKD